MTDLGLDIRDFGALCDTTNGTDGHDDTIAIQKAIVTLPPYAVGKGGGSLLIPGFSRVTAPIVLTQGVRLVGTGLRSSGLLGAIDGPLLTTALPLNQTYTYAVDLEHLLIANLSTSPLASCGEMEVASALFNRIHCQAKGTAKGGLVLRGSIVATIRDSHFASDAGATGTALLLDGGNTGGNGGCNVVRVEDSSFLDFKIGIDAIAGDSLSILGCQFENQAAANARGFRITGVNGGVIRGNSFESINGWPGEFRSTYDYNWAFEIGANYAYNFKTLLFNIGALRNSRIGPNYVSPGAYDANPAGIWIDQTYCTDNEISKQVIHSGTGKSVNVAANCVGHNILIGGA